MGAQIFYSESKHKDIETAFRLARRSAQLEYGNGGYTGTIAEKYDYVVISAKPMLVSDAEELAKELIWNDDPRVSDKWGAAGAIAIADPTTPNEISGWLFFGVASS